MIAKLTVGNGLRGAVSYDLLPKKGEPNRAEWIAGTLGGIGATPQQISRQGRLLRALRPEIKNPIWRCSLSLPPSDGRRDATFWKQIVEEFLIEMEIPLDAGWLAVRHDDQNHDHLHLSVIRILPNSKLWNRANDLPKAVKATQKLEERHGLATHSREKPKKSSPTLAGRQISKRKSQPMPKIFVQNQIDSIFGAHKNGLAFEELQALLAPKGVSLDEKRTKQGKLQGLSFRCQDIAFPASALGSDYSTSGLIRRGLIVQDQIDIAKIEPQESQQHDELKEKIQKTVDRIFHEQKLPIGWEHFQTFMQRDAVRVQAETDQNGQLKFSYVDIKTGVVIPAASLGERYNLGLLERGLEYLYFKPVKAEAKPASKMPAALKPLILPEQYSAKEIKPHAAHQTEVLDQQATKFNLAPIQTLEVGPLSKVMLMLGFACINLSMAAIEAIFNFIKAILRKFGFDIKVADEQPAASKSHQLPLFYSPTPQALPTPTAEHQAALEISRILSAVENNSPADLPVVEGTDKEREQAFAALADADHIAGAAAATTAEADLPDNFGFVDADFAAPAPIVEHNQIDPIEALKAALKADVMANFFLEKAKRKIVPLHVDISDLKQEFLSEIVSVRQKAETDFETWKADQGFLKSKLPSATKTSFEIEIVRLQKLEVEAKNELANEVAKTAKYDQLLKNTPAPVVPATVKEAAETARKALVSARDALQNQAILIIQALQRDPKQYAKMGVFEFELAKSLKEFHQSEQISDVEMTVLERQMNELKKLKSQQDESGFAPPVASDFETDGDADKPVVDGQTVK